MPKRVPVIKTVTKKDPLLLFCEWQECTSQFTEMKPFLDHLTEHLQTFAGLVQEQRPVCEETGQPVPGSVILFVFLTALIILF